MGREKDPFFIQHGKKYMAASTSEYKEIWPIVKYNLHKNKDLKAHITKTWILGSILHETRREMTDTFHTYVTFANPYLHCCKCGVQVLKWHNDSLCECNKSFWNLPCGHRAGVISVCLSWSPLIGCSCQEMNYDHKLSRPS